MTVSPGLWPTLKAVQLVGANTNVGKTVVATSLARAARQTAPSVRYLKPVSTGPEWEADDGHISKYAPGTLTNCLFRFSDPVSPHIAARAVRTAPSDRLLLKSVRTELESYVDPTQYSFLLLETAGGPLSPGPSGTPQADLYRPLRLPVMLVADSRLGGISATVSAYESVTLRGYDVVAIAVFDDKQWGNYEYIKTYFSKTTNGLSGAVIHPVPVFPLAPPPERETNEERERDQMNSYYAQSARSSPVKELVSLVSDTQLGRIKQIESLPERSLASVWYPFMQHQGKRRDDIRVFDSAYRDTLVSRTTPAERGPSDNMLKDMFDGPASWWTQGLGHGNPELSLAAAYGAGRYGHVIFAGAATEPAVGLVEDLLAGMQSDHHERRLTRGFYSDDGSTAVEVAIKMALRASQLRAKTKPAGADSFVLGLRGSYHGDTVGAMNCSEPSVYNETVAWYQGKGAWFDYPTVGLKDGVWKVEWPRNLEALVAAEGGDAALGFPRLEDVFDLEARESDADVYRRVVQRMLEQVAADANAAGKHIGALIIEPIILGAGGMHLCDPLFQSVLVQAVRESGDLFGSRPPPAAGSGEPAWAGMPVVYDEVFTGLYRLGRFSSSSFLRRRAGGSVAPDISVHAKLLTGGLVPLAVTLASEHVFDAFLGPDSTSALLHGHSYTAHPVGCVVARQALAALRKLHTPGPAPGRAGAAGVAQAGGSSPIAVSEAASGARMSVWDDGALDKLSRLPEVEKVVGIGSVLAITLKAEQGGYTSSAGAEVRDRLAVAGDADSSRINIYARVLGNVVYVMASQATVVEDARRIEETILAVLSEKM